MSLYGFIEHPHAGLFVMAAHQVSGMSAARELHTVFVTATAVTVGDVYRFYGLGG